MRLCIIIILCLCASVADAQSLPDAPHQLDYCATAPCSGTTTIPALPFRPRWGTVNVDVIYPPATHWVRVTLPVPHRTADKAFWARTIFDGALTVGDVENSKYALGKSGVYEMNPILGRHPTRLDYYSLDLPLFGLTAYADWRWKREDDAERAAGLKLPWERSWIPQAINGFVHVVGIIITVGNTKR